MFLYPPPPPLQTMAELGNIEHTVGGCTGDQNATTGILLRKAKRQ